MESPPLPSPREPEQDLSGLVGCRFIYTFRNGWKYELYVKNSRTIDYRVHSGIVGSRRVKDQPANIRVLDQDVYRISFHEPTGTFVVLNLLPAKLRVFATVFFAHWVEENPQTTVLFQKEHLDRTHELRDAGPTYPMSVIPLSATIAFLEYVGEDNEAVIASPPAAA
jgi:phenolic acid decarboxylase